MALPSGWSGTGRKTSESGQSWLHQARRDGDDALYALKRCKNKRRAGRFSREVETMQTLRTSGIAVPEIMAFDLDGERPWFAMPWFEEGSLEAAVKEKRFDGDIVGRLRMLRALSSILSDVHDADVAHRDLKLGNVLLDGEDLLLTDFGLCLDVPEDPGDADRLTATDEAVGSRHYIAPENESGFNLATDQRPADFYAFGKVVSALLAGRDALPRESELDAEEALTRVCGEMRLAPVDALLRDLLNRDPRARLIDWAVIGDELRAVEADLSGQRRPSPRTVEADVLRLARRVRTRPDFVQQLEQANVNQRQASWYGDLVSQMGREVQQVMPSLEPLRAELLDLLDIAPTSGMPPTAALSAVGTTDLPGAPPQGVVPQSQAVGYLLHCPRGLASLPGMSIKIWPVCREESVWIVRAPTLSRAGGTEEVPTFLLESIYDLSGPFAAYRRATFDQARDFVAETGRLFIALAEQYVSMVAGDLDPGAASAWEGLTLVAAEADERTQGKRGDAEPPDLIDLRLEAGHVDRSPDLTTVTVTAHIVDELSGISHGNGSSPSQARLSSPSGQFRDVMFIPTTRVSGDDHDGTYSQAVELGEHAGAGAGACST
jgi:serine/threonine protein kinase